MLYLPPLWFHMVESLEVSISVNVWTDSFQSMEMEKVFYESVPKPSGSTKRSTSLFLVALIRAILETLYFEINSINPTTGDKSKATQFAVDFLNAVYTVRYSPLYKSGQLPASTISPSPFCTQADLEELRSYASIIATRKTVLSYVKNVVTRFATLPDISRELWLGNYVEFISVGASDVKNAGHFLKELQSCIV